MDSEPGLKSQKLDRISVLAQPKRSKTVWATTPWELTWGNQESIRPLSQAALQAIPSPRIQALAKHKKDFALQIQLRKEEEERMMKSWRPSSFADQYELNNRLSTPRARGRSALDRTSPHSLLCDHDCPIWHVSPSVRNAIVSPRILHLANPKTNHPNFTSNRQNVQTLISYAAQTAKMTARLEQLSLPRLREDRHFFETGPPETPIRPVSRGARKATASARIRSLSTPKALSKDYIPPRDPTWRS